MLTFQEEMPVLVLSAMGKTTNNLLAAGEQAMQCDDADEVAKLEPVLADDGELIIYAPHITEVSFSHGDIIK